MGAVTPETCRVILHSVASSWIFINIVLQNIVFSFNSCLLVFQTATKLVGQIVSKLFRSKYFLKGKCWVLLLA